MKPIASLLIGILCLSTVACSNTTEPISSSASATPPSASGTQSNSSTQTPTPQWDQDPTRWMEQLEDNTPLYAITIPGTHDSGATRDDFLGKFAQCQSLSIAEQLNCGVRFFDIRLKLIGDSLDVYHSIVDQQTTFEEVRAACREFLANHPGETILMSIKQEDDNNADFAKAVEAAMKEDSNLWYLQRTLPTLGQARGKIVLFRRYDNGTKGINCRSSWADNTDFTMNNGVTIHVQDYYALETTDNISVKWNKFEALAKTAYKGNDLCINFASGYTGLSDIKSVSDKMNPKITKYFATKKGSFGIILCDFIYPDLASLLIATNF